MKIKDAVMWQKPKAHQKKLKYLYQLIMRKEVEPMEDFLNRILFDKPWVEDNHLQSWEYIQCYFHGAWNIEKFIFVPVDLIHEQIKLKIQQTKTEAVLAQLQKGLKIVEDKINRKVKFLIIDGMGRTLTTWTPFFQGEDWARIPSTDIIKPIIVDFENGTEECLNGKMWADISSQAKKGLLNIGIDIAIVESGAFGEITMCLVSKNKNDKWTDWQQLYHAQFISSFAFHIKNVLTEPIKDFLRVHTNIEQTNYKEGKSGYEMLIALLLLYIAQHRIPDGPSKKGGLYAQAFETDSTIVTEKHVKELKNYLMELVDAFPKSKTDGSFYTPQFIRNYIILRDAIEHRKTADEFFAMRCDKIVDLRGKLAEKKKFVFWFIKKHEWLIAKFWSGGMDDNGIPEKVINHLSWSVQDEKWTAIKGGYVKASTSDSSTNFSWAQNHLLEQFSQSIEDLVQASIWKMTTRNDTPSIKEVATFRGWKDRHNNDVSPDMLSNYIIGHIIPEKSPEGETELRNLVLQLRKGNLQYGARQLIGDAIAA